jgi:hypothetical protein
MVVGIVIIGLGIAIVVITGQSPGRPVGIPGGYMIEARFGRRSC